MSECDHTIDDISRVDGDGCVGIEVDGEGTALGLKIVENDQTTIS